MKSLMKIYIKYIATALMLIIAFIFLQLALLGVIVSKLYGEEGYKRFSIGQVYDQLPEELGEGEENEATAHVTALLAEANAVFAMVLDHAGRPIWSYQLPEHLNHVYTSSQIASFTRWYLDDYPVTVWGGHKGLLVVGHPKDSVWIYNIREDMDDLTGLMTFFSLSFLSFIGASALILLVSGFRYYRRMRVITDSISRLASGGSVHLAETGAIKEIAPTLNRTSDRLTRQREELERRDEARSEWVSGVSHDIRTPLSLVMGYADMIENKLEAGEEIRSRAALIRRQSIRIRDLIEDLNLTFKLGYHMQPLRMKQIQPAVILRRVAADLLNSMEDPELYPFTIQIRPDFENLSMEGDEGLIYRAFQNILGNSVRHNQSGCRLQVRACVEEGAARISFCDDGCGIPPDICRYLNEGEMPREEIHLMGLKIVKQIVMAHGGNITAGQEGRLVSVEFPPVHGNPSNDASS